MDIVFFQKIDVKPGGMEIHSKYFRRYFETNNENKIICSIYRKSDAIILNLDNENFEVDNNNLLIRLSQIIRNESQTVFFFNDGHFIKDIPLLRRYFKHTFFMIRSGGNEFLGANIFGDSFNLKQRQEMWSDIINNNCDCVIANSEYTRQRMLEAKFSQNIIVVIRGGIDAAICLDNHQNKADIRKLINRHIENDIKDKIIIVVASRLVMFKGISIVISALGRLRNKSRLHLIIAGEGYLKDSLLEKCNNLLPEQYTYVGYLNHDNTLKLIAAADIFINCSIYDSKKSVNGYYIHTETMGRGIMEAIGSYVPIVATNVGAIPELFDENQYIGEMVEPFEENIAEAIDYLIENKVKLYSTPQIYDWKEVFSAYEDIWREHKKILCV